MKSAEVVTSRVINHHITVIGDPRPYQPVQPTQVPDGGSTWSFVLAATITIGLTAACRYFQDDRLRKQATTSH